MLIKEFITTSADGAFVNVEPPVFSPDDGVENRVLNIYDGAKDQTVLGFGGAFTESSAYCYSRLAADKRKALAEAYFSAGGANYNFCRMHIGSCDFSLAEYAYTTPYDKELSRFDLGQDKKYVLPFIKDALQYSPDMFIFASPWSPPYWMKDTGSAVRGGKLAAGYMGVWAEYVVKYIERCRDEGVHIAGVTVQNEPNASQTWESCVYTAAEEARLVADYLAPAFDAHGLDTKIIIWDHNKERLYERARETMADPEVEKRVFGVGFHWYSGAHYDAVRLTHEKYPDKYLIESEFCGGMPGGETLAFSYAREMLMNLNNGMSASVDWNMLLDKNGGPHHYRTGGCSSPVTVDTETGDFTLTPVYYAVAHFSKYIARGSVRLYTSTFSDRVMITAFERPDADVAAVILNETDERQNAALRFSGGVARLVLPPRSICTAVVGRQ